jgi:hypothetical protein
MQQGAVNAGNKTLVSCCNWSEKHCHLRASVLPLDFNQNDFCKRQFPQPTKCCAMGTEGSHIASLFASVENWSRMEIFLHSKLAGTAAKQSARDGGKGSSLPDF